MSSIFFISLLFMGVSFLVSATLKNKFARYSQIPLSRRLTGKEVAEKMLQENGIFDVKVISSNGYLTDHYNPLTKTVNLSDVYNGNSIASTAVAAHECGHAVQHATAYAWLMLRSRLVTFCSVQQRVSSMDLAGRYYNDKGVSCPALDRDSPLCHNYDFCFHNIAGGI